MTSPFIKTRTSPFESTCCCDWLALGWGKAIAVAQSDTPPEAWDSIVHPARDQRKKRAQWHALPCSHIILALLVLFPVCCLSDPSYLTFGTRCVYWLMDIYTAWYLLWRPVGFFLFFLFFLKIYLFIYFMYVSTLSLSSDTPEEVTGSHYRWLWATMRLLGNWTQVLWKSSQCS
jgi:hypothetical protein